NSKRLSYFLEGVLGAVFQSEAHLDDFLLAGGKRAQHLGGLLFEVYVDYGLGRRDHAAVFDEIAQMRIFFFANGGLKRDRLLRNLQHLTHLRDRDIHALGDLLGSWFASEFLHKLARGANQLVNSLDHVDRNTDGAGLVGNSTRNGLADPPGGIG